LKIFKHPLFAMALLTLAMLAPRANATLVTAVECSVNIFPCPAPLIIDSGFRTNGVGLLAPDQFAPMTFVFNNADVVFAGQMLTADIGGLNIYVWGGGAATNLQNNPLFPGGFYMDVAISQNYVTAPGVGLFSEFNNGTCTNNTIGTASGVAASLGVNGGFMPVMGNFGDCVAGGAPGGVLTGFNFAAGPFAFGIGNLTNLTAVAQFYFDPAGGAGQSIDLPWGENFPDTNLALPDPSNIDTFGLTNAVPEPGTLVIMWGALGLLALRRRRT